MSETMSPRATIARIDREIDAVVANLISAVKSKPRTASGFQKAWDKHPDLEAQFRGLYRQRGIAQVARDELETERRVRAVKSPRPIKCPTCGTPTFKHIGSAP